MARTTAESEALAAALRENVITYLTAKPGEWVTFAELLALAPEGRIRDYAEIGEAPFGSDDPRGPAYDAGPSGQPDGGMLDTVMSGLGNDLLADRTLPRAHRLYDPDELIGLEEIGRRLHVKRDTVDHWRHRASSRLPDPDPGDAHGRRPRWRWQAIRDWAIETGRTPAGPNGPRWNGRNGEESGSVVDAGTAEPYQRPR